MDYFGAENDSFELRQQAQQFLRADEKLLWVARPDKRQFTKLQWPMVFFGLFWSAITLGVSGAFIYAMFFTPQNAKNDFPNVAKPFILLFFVPFWAVGFYMLGGHKLLARNQWKKTLYMLTSQNIVIRNGKSEVRLDHDAARNVQIDRLKNGLGTIRFLGGGATAPINISFGKFNFQIPVGTRVQSNDDATAKTLCFQAVAEPDGFIALVRKMIEAKETAARNVPLSDRE